jgi:hypothetical protein
MRRSTWSPEALKGMAKRLNVVLIAPAQCNHKDSRRGTDKRPQIRDFQGASGMAQDADFVAMIYKDDDVQPGALQRWRLDFSGRGRGKFASYLDYDPKSLAIYEKQKPAVRGVA